MSPLRRAMSLALVLGLGASVGCAAAIRSVRPEYADPPHPWSRSYREFVAGVATVDITPPPLLGLFGHGPEGRVAIGTLGHLRCRVFYLSAPVEELAESVALVPCDLAAISGELHRAVVRRTRELLRDDGAVATELGHDRVFLMATHTHGGPAHYFESSSYAGPFGSSLPGFDPAVVDFLADRIATGIAEAVRSARPAVAAWHYAQARGISRNRSMEAFGRNLDESLPAELATVVLRPYLRLTSPLPELAVDRRVSVLRLDECVGAPSGPGRCTAPGSHRPMGVFAVFGMHPSVLPNTNDLYHGDVFAHAAQTIEDSLARELATRRDTGPAPVVGIANGVEGDVSPTWQNHSDAEMNRLGGALAEVITASWLHLEDALRPVLVRARFVEPYTTREVRPDVPEGATVPTLGFGRDLSPAPPTSLRVSPPTHALCARPELGAVAAGGASDHPTQYRIFREFNEGVRSTHAEGDTGCHGPRVPLQFLSAFRGGIDFPNTAPMGIIQIGEGVLATVPAEVTTVVGMSIAETLRQITPAGVAQVTMVGLTDSYLSYVTTPAEYLEQRYEGASNLYGPWSAEFYRGHLGCLAQTMFGPQPRPATDCTATAAAIAHHAEPGGGVRWDSHATLLPAAERIRELPSEGIRLCREVVGGAPTFAMIFPWAAPETYFRWESMRLEVLRDDGDPAHPAVVTTQNRDDLELRFIEHDPRAFWRARWRPGFAEAGPLWNARYRFRFRFLDLIEINSEWFSPPGELRPCR